VDEVGGAANAAADGFGQKLDEGDGDVAALDRGLGNCLGLSLPVPAGAMPDACSA
jgi:hypothetical protein